MKKKPLVILLTLLILIVAIDFLLQANSTITLQGFFTNDDNNYFPANQIEKEYKRYLGSKEKVVFEDSLYIVPGSSKEYVTASASKVVAYIAAHELDFIVTTKANVLHYTKGVAFAPINEYLPLNISKEDILYGTDGNGKYMPLAVNLKHSRFLKGTGEEEFYLFIPQTSKRKENVKPFLTWVFDQR